MDSVPIIDFSWHVVTLSDRWRLRGGFGVVIRLGVRGVESASLLNEEQLELAEGKGGP